MRQHFLLSGLFLSSSLLFVSAVSADTEIYKDERQSINMRGYFSVDYLYSDDDDALTDSTSRIGFHFTRAIDDKWQAVGGIEWGVDLVDASEGFKFSQGDGFRPDDARDDNIWSRIGYVGIKHSTYGSLTLGKQWGVYYDVTWVTDLLESYGGEASGTYNFRTDGGANGTGRADEAIIYRNSFGDFSFGAQYQPGSESIDISDLDPLGQAEFDNRYGVSLVYSNPLGFTAGVAYNAADVDVSVPTEDADDNSALAFSASYGAPSGDGPYAAIVYVQTESHEIDDRGVVIDTEGIEAFARWGFMEKAAVYGAYNSMEEDDSDYGNGPNEEFELEYMVIGASYAPIEDFLIYTEWKFEDSTNADGSSPDDVYGVGLKYSF